MLPHQNPLGFALLCQNDARHARSLCPASAERWRMNRRFATGRLYSDYLPRCFTSLHQNAPRRAVAQEALARWRLAAGRLHVIPSLPHPPYFRATMARPAPRGPAIIAATSRRPNANPSFFEKISKYSIAISAAAAGGRPTGMVIKASLPH